MRISPRTIFTAFFGIALTTGMMMQDEKRPGYDDTPLLPGQEFRVHDARRPYPAVVAPGTTAPSPPADAIVLFDGDDLEAWSGRAGPAGWTLGEGWFEVKAGSGDIRTRREFGSCQLHLEWAAPAKIAGQGQGRGNSGIFFMDRYEVQVLDSFRNPTYADGQAAALYGQYPPLVNACREPGAWQSYDIVFEAPRFADDELVAPARVTVFHNGVLVHHARELLGPTAHRTLPVYRPHGARAPIRLQDHGNPVRYRNVWLREI